MGYAVATGKMKAPNIEAEKSPNEKSASAKWPTSGCSATAASAALVMRMPFINKVFAVVTIIKKLKNQNKSILIFDDQDALLSLMSGSGLYSRYRPIDIFTQQQLNTSKKSLIAFHTDYVVIKKIPDKANDILQETNKFISENAQVIDSTEVYNIWLIK